MKNKRKFILILIAFITIVLTGVFGYWLLLDISFIDAIYMTAITLSTVGFGEVSQMTDTAKLFTIGIIFSGLSVVGYAVTNIVAVFFEGEFKEAWRRKRMAGRIEHLKDHYIVCGAGDVGNTVIKHFIENNLDFVVLEKSEDKTNELVALDVLAMNDDATNEEALIKAGVERAKGVICTLASDADNVFTVLTARQLNPKLYIIAKAIEENTHKKLKKAGADNTISPNEIGGTRIASMIIRPSVISFLDIITRADKVTLDLEEVLISQGSVLIGKSLKDARIPERTGLIVMAIKKKGMTTLSFNPSSSQILDDGDTMIVLGKEEKIDKLKSLACDESPHF